MSSSPSFRERDRSYVHALALLKELASNRAVVNMVGSSAADMNAKAIPEMIEWLRKAGYQQTDLLKFRAVHVAGTKGKGSVSAMVASILQACDRSQHARHQGRELGRIGLYTSPHLITPRERICIDSVPLSETLFARYFFDIWDRFSMSAGAEKYADPVSAATKPGYFRFLTIMAFHTFLQEGIESVVVECGIGGEYDSTNVLPSDAITVTAITRLGIDHVAMLGSTIESIAWHKAGIFKTGVKAFTVPQDPGAMEVLTRRAEEKDTALTLVERRSDIQSGIIKIVLDGEYQKENASLAVAVALAHLQAVDPGQDHVQEDQLADSMVEGLEKVTWQGRCDVRIEGNIRWCVDGAHTIESIEAATKWFAKKTLDRKADTVMLLFNQQTRDAPALVRKLYTTFDDATGGEIEVRRAIFCANTPYLADLNREATEHPGLSVQEALSTVWKSLHQDGTVRIYETVEEAMNDIRHCAEGARSVDVFVTGSLHLVGGFLEVLEKPNGRT